MQKTHDTLTAAEEAALVTAAQEGDRSAMERLLSAYDRWLRKLAHQRSRTCRTETDDLLQEARLAFMEAVRTIDPRQRLSTATRAAVMRELHDAGHQTPVSIPPRTVRRYWAAMDACQSAEEAAERAGEFELSREAFWSAHAALTRSTALNAATVLPEAPTGYPEDQEANALARRLVDSLEGRERDVIRHAFGFATGAPMTDEEVATALGMSRPTVQRVRKAALAKLGAAA